jgi:tRNA threonylcarbamoyladenosine biosynthesis protein TsaB
MSRVLAIETSGRVGSVALAHDGRVLVEAQFPHGLKHAAEIVPTIDRLCREQGWRPVDIEAVYVSVGPGSFTGLRIGITLAKTLAFARGVKLVAVPSVRVLVENAPADARHAVIVLDAKREQIFTARFEKTKGAWVEREPARVDSLVSMLSRSPRPVHLIGEGIPYHEKFIPREDREIVVTPAESWRARAAAVAKLGGELAGAGAFADPYRLAPIYIRPPEAEEKLALRSG